MTAALALQADVRTQPDDRPFIGTARVRLSQAEQVIKFKVGKHGWGFKGSGSLEIIPRRATSSSL